jgi:hypothetical protein
MTCQIVSIAHWLPHREEMEIDPTASEATVREAQRQAGREHQQEVEADDPGRDILWPLEQVRAVTQATSDCANLVDDLRSYVIKDRGQLPNRVRHCRANRRNWVHPPSRPDPAGWYHQGDSQATATMVR